MCNGQKRYTLYIGSWQPFDRSHKLLIDQALANGENVCIVIKDTAASNAEHISVEQREAMIARSYGDKVKIIVTSDLKNVNTPGDFKADADSYSTFRKMSREGNPESTTKEHHLSGITLWLTGLPCSGKTTLSKQLKDELEKAGIMAVHLDADDVRNKLNADLGFSPEDRKENLRRVAHIAKLFNDNGNFVIASFLSPTKEYRAMVKEIIGNLKMVYVKCSLGICETRDVKGMYKKARRGELKDFTGVSAPFEEPEEADIVVDTEHQGVAECVKVILRELGV